MNALENTSLRTICQGPYNPFVILPDGVYVSDLMPISDDQKWDIISLLTREGRLTLENILWMAEDDVMGLYDATVERLRAEHRAIVDARRKAQIEARKSRRSATRRH